MAQLDHDHARSGTGRLTPAIIMAPRRRHVLLRRPAWRCATKPPQRPRSIRSAACRSIRRPPSIVSHITGRIISSAQAAAATLRSRAGKISGSRSSPSPRRRPAPSTPARCIREVRQVGPGQLSDLRHGAGARTGLARRRAGSRTRRHDAAVLDRAGADAAGVRARDGRPSRSDASGAAGLVELDFVRAGDAGGAVGGRAVLRARLAFAA